MDMRTARKEIVLLICLLIAKGIHAQESGASKGAVKLPEETTIRYAVECTSRNGNCDLDEEMGTTVTNEVATEVPNLDIEDLQPATVGTTPGCSDECVLQNRAKCMCDCKTGQTLQPLNCEKKKNEASEAVAETVGGDSTAEQTTGISGSGDEELEEITTTPPTPADEIQKEPSFTCDQAGTFAATLSNNSYHWCIADPSGSLRQYFVTCRAGEVYFPQLGKCFIDYNNLENLPADYQQTQFLPDQEDIIENELKQLKQEEKKRLKLEKQKKKLEEKLQKEVAKKAKKEAKEQAKLATSSKESESFLCTQEGNFASTVSRNRYFSCVSKKGKFKVATLYCAVGQGFDPSTGACAAINSEKATDDLRQQ